jgi:DNA invertase Pin-like site-specific DNA recombinase
MKVIAYTRLSKGERDALGLEAQRTVIQQECERRGWQPDVRVEIMSGARAANRTVLQAALRELDSGDVLVVAKLDRLSRSVVDAGKLLAEAQRRGFNIVALDFGLDLSTPQGELVANILTSVAQWERRVIGERIAAALAVKKARGWTPHRCPPRIPKAVRERIVAMAEAGASQRRIAEVLNREGVQAQGSRWHRGTVIRVLTQEAV